MASGVVVSVNVGLPRTVEWFGRHVTTAIWKEPVAGRVAMRGVNLDGDDQADRRVHGGVDKAVYAYATEDYEWWAKALGTALTPGTFGENLTVAALDLGTRVVGEQWRVGTARLEVAQPRLPCFKLGVCMGDASFVDRFDDARRYGAYLRIIDEGDVAANDVIDVLDVPAHGLTVADIANAYTAQSDELLDRLLAVDTVPAAWREWAERALARRA